MNDDDMVEHIRAMSPEAKAELMLLALRAGMDLSDQPAGSPITPEQSARFIALLQHYSLQRFQPEGQAS